MKTLLAGAALVLAMAAPARADDELAGVSVIFARGGSLYRVDARGKGETEVATLPAKTSVRALRTDAAGSVLLADLGGHWSWMPLDGSTKTLADLPCAEGPAQLAEDGTCVVCRSPDPKVGAILYNLGKQHASLIAISASGRLADTPDGRELVWADSGGVWTAPVESPGRRTKVAPAPPLRGFLASPDGKRALGVYAEEVYTDAHHKKPGEVLMNFALDGEGARRKAIRDGVPLEWSHDSQYALVQDGGKACLMKASGGEYKCWKGFTAASVASDGSWALVLGNRDGTKAPAPAPAKAGAKAPAKPAEKPAEKPADEPTDEVGSEGGEPAGPDVPVAPPSGPLSLYRGKLDGPYTDPPVLIVKLVDGAAVWIPAPKQN